MKTDDAIEALAEQLARAFVRQLEPLLRELLAAQPTPADAARPARVRAGAPPRTAYSVAEVAAMTGLSRAHLYREIEAGRLRAIRSGRRVIVPVAVVDDLIARR